MALGDVVQSVGFSVFSSSATLPEAATVGNSIVVFSNASNASLSVSDDLNGAYTKIGTAGADPMISIFLVTNTSAASAPVITISSAGRRSFAMELEGDLVAANAGGSSVLSPLSVGPTSFSTSTANIPAGSVSVGAWGASVDGSGVTADSPWTGVPGNNVTYPFFVRQDASAVTGGAFSGTYDGFDGTFDAAVLFVPLESAGGPSGPTLSSVPATAYPGQSRTITGSGFGATKGTGGATLGGVTQTVTAWSDTSITFTTVQSGLKFQAGLTLEVTTDGGQAVSDTMELIVEPTTGGYIDVVDPAVADTSSLAYQFETAGGDPVATGDQCEWRYTGEVGDPTSMTVQADTLISALDAEGAVDVRFWDATDSTWGPWTELQAESADRTPDQFSLGANVTGAEPGSTTQRTFTLAGIDSGETVTVTSTGSATATPSTAGVGDTIAVELTAGTFEAVVTGGVSIGGVSDSFSVTSRAAVLPTQDVTLPDLSLGETDAVSIDLDDYFSGASSYTLTGIPTDSGLTFSGSVLSGNVNKDDIAASPFTLTATAISADGSINDAFSVTVVDDIAPVISIGPLTTTDTTPIVSGSAEDATSLTLVVDGVTYNPTPSGGSWSQQLNELALDTYTMTLNGEDAAGNPATQVQATLNVVDETIDPPGAAISLRQKMRVSLRQSLRQSLRGN